MSLRDELAIAYMAGCVASRRFGPMTDQDMYNRARIYAEAHEQEMVRRAAETWRPEDKEAS